MKTKKMFLIVTRRAALKIGHDRLYYWTEKHLYPLRGVVILPVWWHKACYKASMSMVGYGRCLKMADWLIHRVPYQMRFNFS